uniref:CBS domain-containing protein n=2 Tax=Timspurckia oligopyrenoides TaxID=708627 RepID=A0A7S0ZHW3_9RHOD|mmetsp:Transcript_592/g.1064  ORF Transcript_592/g.1064 Transcript_592/m.1064 type:complete len:304 (+) Transcript_592:96-1007(+)
MNSFFEDMKLSALKSELPLRSKLHAISIESDINSALEYLDSEKLILAPVLDHSGKYSYIIGVHDLVYYCISDIESIDEIKLISDKESLPKLNHKIHQMIEMKPKEYFMLEHVDSNDSVKKALELLSKGNHKVFVNDQDKNSWLLSQHDMIIYLNNHPEIVSESVKKLTMKSLGFSEREITSQDSNASAFSVLKSLVSFELTAMPLLDGESGRIVGNFSTSDLIGMDAVMIQELALTARQFLDEKDARGAGHPVTVEESATVAEVLVLLAYSGAHRVWIADSNKMPMGVVAMTDLLTTILSEVS